MSSSLELHLDGSFDRIATLPGGHRVRLRWIRASDAGLLREGFDRLSEESRRMRFFVPLRRLPEDAVRYLTDVDGYDHAALVALSIPEPGAPEHGLGVARFVRMKDDPTKAELALTVVDDCQRLGLGTLLLLTLGAAARERGIETFTMNLLSTNYKVRRLLLRLDADSWARDGDMATCAMSTSGLANRGLARWLTAA
jgi:GNAT superfamily N-acetyltransferase